MSEHLKKIRNGLGNVKYVYDLISKISAIIGFLIDEDFIQHFE